MLRRLSPALLCTATLFCALTMGRVGTPAHGAEIVGLTNPIHGYYTQQPQDRFTRFKAEYDAGLKPLDSTSELSFLTSLLEALEVPISSQMLVYSVTSLQKPLISPRRPRALYFNDDTYVGHVPGGQIEIISVDPELGGIFYIFDRVRNGRAPGVQRADDCLNCHSPRHMEEIPGLIIESVVPGITGGGEKAFRREQSGHQIPLEQRFGGWHVTGTGPEFPRHWGNMLLVYTDAGRVERPIAPGELFSTASYPVDTSDILPHLLHEHQVGFDNRAIQAIYRTRASLHRHGGKAEAFADELDAEARALVRYLLFTDEVPLPSPGIEGDAQFKKAFVAKRRVASTGESLKDLDLQSRLLRYRCSYMIYSPAFTGLPTVLKERVFALLARALREDGTDADFAHLEKQEKAVILRILTETLVGFGQGATARR